MVFQIEIDVTDNYMSLIFKFQQYKNVNIANLQEN